MDKKGIAINMLMLLILAGAFLFVTGIAYANLSDERIGFLRNVLPSFTIDEDPIDGFEYLRYSLGKDKLEFSDDGVRWSNFDEGRIELEDKSLREEEVRLAFHNYYFESDRDRVEDVVVEEFKPNTEILNNINFGNRIASIFSSNPAHDSVINLPAAVKFRYFADIYYYGIDGTVVKSRPLSIPSASIEKVGPVFSLVPQESDSELVQWSVSLDRKEITRIDSEKENILLEFTKTGIYFEHPRNLEEEDKTVYLQDPEEKYSWNGNSEVFASGGKNWVVFDLVDASNVDLGISLWLEVDPNAFSFDTNKIKSGEFRVLVEQEGELEVNPELQTHEIAVLSKMDIWRESVLEDLLRVPIVDSKTGKDNVGVCPIRIDFEEEYYLVVNLEREKTSCSSEVEDE